MSTGWGWVQYWGFPTLVLAGDAPPQSTNLSLLGFPECFKAHYTAWTLCKIKAVLLTQVLVLDGAQGLVLLISTKMSFSAYFCLFQKKFCLLKPNKTFCTLPPSCNSLDVNPLWFPYGITFATCLDSLSPTVSTRILTVTNGVNPPSIASQGGGKKKKSPFVLCPNWQGLNLWQWGVWCWQPQLTVLWWGWRIRLSEFMAGISVHSASSCAIATKFTTWAMQDIQLAQPPCLRKCCLYK